ncbi:MAG: radical SAM protein [Acidobacteriota bacterium]|nr:radical SAM protein [Acidobacteriota bacterium]MDQ5836747.1 radical SAM protein [Acidobacteriota bacterium]
MKRSEVFSAWGRILTGRYPSLSVEITRECPLRCPGCYAYEPEHLGAEVGPLRTLADSKGQELVEGMLAVVRKYRPLHLSIVGGEPLVRFRELNTLLPALSEMGVAVQLVTSAVRRIPPEWDAIKGLHLVVSVDGLQPDHDERRKPATYERILQNIAGQRVTIHCTITRQQTERAGYFEEFLEFWSARPEVKKVWFSLFTPQVGACDDEIIPADARPALLAHLSELGREFPKLVMPKEVTHGYLNPPQSPAECIFARTTLSLTADLKSRITPCQFGGTPDCKQCGCIASAGLKAVGDHRVLGFVPLRSLYNASDAFGKAANRFFRGAA